MIKSLNIFNKNLNYCYQAVDDEVDGGVEDGEVASSEVGQPLKYIQNYFVIFLKFYFLFVTVFLIYIK